MLFFFFLVLKHVLETVFAQLHVPMVYQVCKMFSNMANSSTKVKEFLKMSGVLQCMKLIQGKYPEPHHDALLVAAERVPTLQAL